MNLSSTEDLINFLIDHCDYENYTHIFGPNDGFEKKMSSAELSVSKDDHSFDNVRALCFDFAHDAGVMGMWLQRHIEQFAGSSDIHDARYKAMVILNCVYTKTYEDNSIEYRRYVFDKMCENSKGTFIKARTTEQLFKMVYNTVLQLLMEKLDGRGTENIPNTDSHFEFYGIATIGVTVFQYQPIKVGSFISLPKQLELKKAIINPQVNEDCFKYSVLIGLLRCKVSSKKWKTFKNLQRSTVVSKLCAEHGVSADFVSVSSPYFHFNSDSLALFCKRNPDILLSIWVPADGKEDRIPIHIIWQSKKPMSRQKEVNLLLLTDLASEQGCEEEDDDDDEDDDDVTMSGEECEFKMGNSEEEEETFRGKKERKLPEVVNHFACITNLDKLFTEYSSKHKVHVCPVCSIRRRQDTKGLGFCKTHESVQHKLATLGRYTDKITVDDAIAEREEYTMKILSTLCPKCSNIFPTEAELQEHKKECLVRDDNYRIINLPKRREYLELSGNDAIKLSMLHSFMVADFESVLQPMKGYKGNQCYDSEHLPCSYSLVMESDYQELCMFKNYIGKDPEDTIANFCRTILAWSKKVHMFYKTNIPMLPLTKEEEEKYSDTEKCYICGKEFIDVQGRKKVHDHDHLTGRYIGAACEGCNINRRPDRQFIPLFFHNGKNYDTHILIKEITKRKYGCKFNGIAQNTQKFLSFKIMKFLEQTKEDEESEKKETERVMCDIKVLDSILFLLSSLNKLTEVQKHKSKWDIRLETEEFFHGYEDVFPITYKWLRFIYNKVWQTKDVPLEQRLYDPKITLALRKNAYPYKWFDSFEKFDLGIEELTKLFDEKKYECFTDNVTEEFKTSFEEKVKVYHEVVQKFGFKTVREYAMLYVCMDTLQLADILQETRHVYRTVHKLDMFQFYGLPGYTWAAFQLHIRDSPHKPWLFKEGEMDMVCFVVRAIRGGCAGTMLRYSHANHKFMDEYDKTKPSAYLLYLDANNLYGWSMSQDLPYGDFEWVPQEKLDKLFSKPSGMRYFQKDFLYKELGKGKGAYIMCDLEFPPEIHDKLNFYPLAPVSGCVPEEWISGYAKKMHETAGTQHDPKSRLLLQTLTPRKQYVVYYKNLKFYLKKGMKLTKVYKVLTFSEAPIMKSYIDKNTAQRNMAGSVAEKNQWKNANNSVYGKTFENQLNYSILKFVSGVQGYNKAVRDPGFDGYAYFNDNLMLARMKNVSVNFNKPIYLGATITELAKLHMFEFYYDVLCEHFGYENIRLCMTDTDSVLVELKCENIYKEIKAIQEKYDCPIDTSTMNPDMVQKYEILGRHNKEVGYFKPEAEPTVITEFVGLRPKVYSTKEQDNPEAHMRCKGTPKDSMAMYVRHESYLCCLFHNDLPENIRQHVDINVIQSKDHHIYSVKSSKVSLSCNDSKRFIMQDNVHTLAFGHYAIPQYRQIYEEGISLKDGEKYSSPLIADIKPLPITYISNPDPNDIDWEECEEEDY